MSFSPKIPILKSLESTDQKGQLRTLTSDEIKQELTMSPIGIAAATVNIIMYIWGYYTSYKKGKLTFKSGDNYGITLSEAVQHSDQIGVTLLLMIFLGLYIGLMVDKGFLMVDSTLKNSVVAVNLAITTGILLLFLIPPSKNSRVQNGIHVMIAGMIIFSSIYSSFMISELYRSEYEDNIFTDSLLGLASTTLILGIISVIIIVIKFFLVPKKGHANYLLNTGLGIAEILMLLAYTAVLYIFSFMPRLINYEKICVGVLEK